MKVKTVLIHTVDANVAVVDVRTAATAIASRTGEPIRNIEADLCGGITFEVDGVWYAPDGRSYADRDNRVTHRMDTGRRAPAWPGGAS